MTVEITEHLLLQLVNKIEDNARRTPLSKPETDNHDLENLEQAVETLAGEVSQLVEEVTEPQPAEIELETSEQGSEEDAEPDSQPKHEARSDSATDKEETGETREGEDTESEIECPQCGDTFEKIRRLSQHNAQKDDHVLPTKFFQGDDDQYYCFECGDDHESRQSLTMHCLQEHDSKLIEYYLEHFDELKKGRVNGVYDYDGNIPELSKPKRVDDYTRDELRRMVPQHLKEQDHPQNLSQIGLTCFDQELETGTSEYTKLYTCVEEADSVKSKPDPNDARQKVYYHETVEA